MNTALLIAASIAVVGPSGRTVCTVTPPAEEQGVSVETKKLDGGLAWRLSYTGSGERVIKDEAWTFDFGADLKCWPVSHAQGEYIPKTLSTIATMKDRPRSALVAAGVGEMYNYATSYPGTAESPLVVEGPGFTAVVGDAGVLDYARLRFKSGPAAGSVVSVLEGECTVALPYKTPWRYVHVRESAVALANAQPSFLDELNEPSRIKDTSWIKPGKVLRVAKLTTDHALAAVDFAKRNGFPYVELDAGWYGEEHVGDPLKPGLAPEKIARGEHLDFFKFMDYAKSNGIGVLLYVNREPLKRNRDEILDTLAGWGVKGIKYGFVNVGSQKWRKWVTEAIEAAAARRLMLDIHDEYRLTGIQRTYPNVLTVEGICGNEEMPNAAHDAALPFTRFLDGPGDYTPCWKVGRVQNTLAHQLALPCVYTSGFQFLFWYQRPDQIDEANPALDFWREIPTAFDETRFLQGEIGSYAVVARRVGKKWFVGCVNAGEKREFKVPLDFAGTGARKVRLYRDADPADTARLAPIACESLEAEVLTVAASANGGFAAIVE